MNARLRYDVRRAFSTGLGPVGVLIVLGLMVATVVPGLLTNQDPYAINVELRLQAPSPGQPFGTDELGRDLLTRVIYGTGISITSALIVVVASGAIGSVVGSLAGFFGGRFDQLMMRLADVFIAFPGLIIAMAIVSILGPSLRNAMISIVLIWWPQYARLARAQVIVERAKLYVVSARAIGRSETAILARHIVPNAWVPLLVKASLDIGLAILLTASLSFLGLGALPPSPELGALITRGKDHILEAWWYATFPGLVMFIAVLGFNLVGDSARDAFDPTVSGG